MDELLGEVAPFAEAPVLLVACGFDGALAPLGDDRALQEASEAMNVLLALPGTTAAVISRRPADEAAELMFLSGAKGGLAIVAPDDVARLKKELGAVAVVVDADAASLAGLDAGDLAVLVDGSDGGTGGGPGARDGAVGEDGRFRVAEARDVVELLEELVDLRR